LPQNSVRLNQISMLFIDTYIAHNYRPKVTKLVMFQVTRHTATFWSTV